MYVNLPLLPLKNHTSGYIYLLCTCMGRNGLLIPLFIIAMCVGIVKNGNAKLIKQTRPWKWQIELLLFFPVQRQNDRKQNDRWHCNLFSEVSVGGQMFPRSVQPHPSSSLNTPLLPAINFQSVRKCWQCFYCCGLCSKQIISFQSRLRDYKHRICGWLTFLTYTYICFYY